MTKVLIHHGEIGLKKGNFNYFETKLVENIKKTSEKNSLKLNKIKRQDKRILCDFEDNEIKISPILKKVFGIKFFSYFNETDADINSITNHVEEIMKDLKKNGIKKIAFKTKRADKSFPLKSPEVNKLLGEISNKLGLKVDYSNPEKTIFIEITSKKVYIYTKKIYCFGGLPVGTGGKVLCLFSGGIDSPVAAWLMMKRGCIVNFLHFHNMKTDSEVLNSKIKKIIEKLNGYQNKSNLFLVPYSDFEIFSQGKVIDRYDLILFKYYMIKTAEKFAIENGYDAIVLGDNLGQVASQTIENIKATSFGAETLIFRPLLTYDKQEIIDLANEIDTYNLSIEKYKDCCSIMAKNPSIKTNLKFFKKILEDLNIEKLITKSLKEINKFEIK